MPTNPRTSRHPPCPLGLGLRPSQEQQQTAPLAGVAACVPCHHSLSSPAHATYRVSLPALRSGRPRAPTDSNRESASGGTRVPTLTASLRRPGEAQERAGTACPSKRPPRPEPTDTGGEARPMRTHRKTAQNQAPDLAPDLTSELASEACVRWRSRTTATPWPST